MTGVSHHSHFCPVSHNTALSSKLAAHRCASGTKCTSMAGNDGTFHQAQNHSELICCLALVAEYLLQIILKAALLPPLAPPASPGPSLGANHLQRKHPDAP